MKLTFTALRSHVSHECEEIDLPFSVETYQNIITPSDVHTNRHNGLYGKTKESIKIIQQEQQQ